MTLFGWKKQRKRRGVAARFDLLQGRLAAVENACVTDSILVDPLMVSAPVLAFGGMEHDL
ncbi:hypothetical protein [Nitrosomonas aestuarii]|uniref:hypothetical protein n=1 Tax=Nitrosomonas aestuarii TaxID=52441 RepID=UPI0011B26E46|nr:hypothetical protein [Nitrosomonas aestuarii]